MEGLAVVAKKSVKKKPGSVISVRCSAEFKAWLESVADERRLTPSQVLEHGAVEIAKLWGVKPPPKR